MAYLHKGMTRSDLMLNVHHALGGNMTNDDKATLIQLMYEKIEAVYEVVSGLEKTKHEGQEIGEKDSVDRLMEDVADVLRTALEK